MDLNTLGAARSYVDDSIAGTVGVLAGKNCTIASTTKTGNITTVVFNWTADDGTVQTTSIQVADGDKGNQGEIGLTGADGVSVTDVTINELDHLICTLSNRTEVDAGLIAGGSTSTKVEASEINGNIKINEEETVVYDSTEITNSLQNKLDITDEATYTIVKTTSESSVAQYHLQKTVNGVVEAVGELINIPKDLIVESGTVESCTVANIPVDGYVIGDKYIDLLLTNSNNEHVYILATDLVVNLANGITYDNANSELAATNVQSAIDELDNSKSDTTHTHNYAASDSAGGAATSAKKLDNTSAIGSVTQPVFFNADGVPIPTSYTVEKSVPSNAVFTDTTYSLATTSANGLMSSTDKAQVDATKIMPQSKSITTGMGTHDYQDFVIPLIDITNENTNTFFYGQIFLKRANAAGGQISLLNVVCCKSYNEEKATYYVDKSGVWTAIRPCSFTYNSKKYFGIHVKITASDYDIIRIDAKTTTNFDIITPVYIYNNNTSAALNAEIYNSLNFNPGESKKSNFYAVPTVINADGTTTKILTFSTVPASATATGTKGDIAYDSAYMYVCTDTNTWKKLLLGTAHEDNTDIHVTSADKTAWNGALISKADATTVNTALDLKANLTDLDEIDNKTVFIGGVEPTRTSALWIQNNVSVSIPETEFIDMPQTNYINITTMSIANQPDGNYGVLYVSIESNAKYRICKQAGHSFRIGTTTSIPQTGTVVNYTIANHTGDQITITTGNTDKYLVIVYWYYAIDPETTKGQMRSTITIDGEIGNTQIHYLDNGNYLPLITSDTATKSQPRNLIGKNILFIGDSITEKNYRTAKNYHDYLAEWFGFKNINKGVSGTGYMDNETFGLGWYNKLLNGFYPSTGVDGIVIMGAINDRYHSVGTYGDSTTTTLFGTLKLMYEGLITRYPKIPILIITSTPRRYSYGNSGNDGTLANYHGHVDAVIQMAKEYSFPCFDLYRNSGLRPWNTTNNTEYFAADGTGVETGPRDPDGVHPNSKGHKIMAQKLFDFINSGLNL